MHKANTSIGAFSLIELMVSVSIVVLVMSVVLAKHTKSNGAVLLRSQAYEVALTARETQLAAVSAVSDGAGIYRNVLGLHFNTATPVSYAIFKDADGDFFFDTGEQFGPQGRLDQRFIIDDIRLYDSGTLMALGVLTDLSVVFQRPNFDARFFVASGVEATAATTAEIDIRLVGSSGSGPESVRTVEITGTGQIVVQ